MENTYALDSDYMKLTAMFIPFAYQIGCSKECTLQFFNVDSFGTETLIQEYTSVAGSEPIDISVDLLGVNYLKIVMHAKSDNNNPCSAALYDIYLTPAA